jgi:hypothetical protein
VAYDGILGDYFRDNLNVERKRIISTTDGCIVPVPKHHTMKTYTY